MNIKNFSNLENKFFDVDSISKETSKSEADSLHKIEVSTEHVLRATYASGGKVYGEQSVERISTLPVIIQILEQRLTYLESLNVTTYDEKIILRSEIKEIISQLESCVLALSGDSHIPLKVQARINKLQKTLLDMQDKLFNNFDSNLLSQIQHVSKTIFHYKNQCKFDWIGSNYVRDCFSLTPEMKSEDPTIAAKAYVDTCKKIIPACVNMRRHEVVGENGEKITMIRTGVISDMRNGYLSLDDLIQAKENKYYRMAIFSQLEIKRRELWVKNQKSTPEYVVLSYAVEQLKSEQSVNQAIAERRACLRNQMLMLILEHVKTLKGNGTLDQTNIIPMMHLSLLNRKTDSVDDTGWKKNEGTFMRDMSQIFKEFDGKKVVFDNQGPLVDNDGIIHLPVQYCEKNQEVHLNTFFSNISVQNNKKNDGIQEDINSKFFAQLRDFFQGTLPSEFQDIEDELIGGKSNFDIAERLSIVAMNRGLLFSIGCLSAKDRTGWVCGKVGVSHVLGNSDMSEKDMLKASKEWSEQILSGPALEVCLECNLRAVEPLNVKALKLTEPNLEGISVMERATQFNKLVSMSVNPDSKKAKAQKIKPMKNEFKVKKDVDFLKLKNRAIKGLKGMKRKIDLYSVAHLQSESADYS